MVLGRPLVADVPDWRDTISGEVPVLGAWTPSPSPPHAQETKGPWEGSLGGVLKVSLRKGHTEVSTRLCSPRVLPTSSQTLDLYFSEKLEWSEA